METIMGTREKTNKHNNNNTKLSGVATTDPRNTIWIAAIGALIYHVSFRLQLRHGVDDCVNAAPIHLFCGIWGVFAASVAYAPSRSRMAYPYQEAKCYSGSVTPQFEANLVLLLFVVGFVSIATKFLEQ